MYNNDPILQYCNIPNREESETKMIELPQDRCRSQLSLQNSNHLQLDSSPGFDESGSESTEYSHDSIGEVSLDSMETVFSSDDQTFADLADPIYKKIIESDVQCDDPILQDICLGMNDTNRKNDFFDFKSKYAAQSPDPLNFEQIEDWDFTMGRSEGSIDVEIGHDSDSVFGSPTENITNFIANELKYTSSSGSNIMYDDSMHIPTSSEYCSYVVRQTRTPPVEIRVPQLRTVYCQTGEKYVQLYTEENTYVVSSGSQMDHTVSQPFAVEPSQPNVVARKAEHNNQVNCQFNTPTHPTTQIHPELRQQLLARIIRGCNPQVNNVHMTSLAI